MGVPNYDWIDVAMKHRVFIGSVWRQIAATVQAFITLDIAALEGTVAAIPSRDLSRVCVCIQPQPSECFQVSLFSPEVSLAL